MIEQLKSVYKLFAKQRYLLNKDLHLYQTIHVVLVMLAVQMLSISWFLHKNSMESVVLLSIGLLFSWISVFLIKKLRFIWSKYVVSVALNVTVFAYCYTFDTQDFYYLFLVNVLIISRLMPLNKRNKESNIMLFIPVVFFFLQKAISWHVHNFSIITFCLAYCVVIYTIRFYRRKIEEKKERLEVVLSEEQSAINSLIKIQKELADKNKELDKKNELIERRATLITQAKESMEKHAQELQIASKFKDEFFSNMSHELRTPLNSIIVLAGIMSENKQGHLTEKEVEYANVISSSGKGLLAIINDILDLSKVEAGKIDLIKETISLDNLLKEMELMFVPVAQKRKVNLGVKVRPHTQPMIYSDDLRLKQVLRNFLSNAIKFTGEGGSVDLEVYNEKDFVRFDVTDTGIGIKKENLEKIFKAFTQAEVDTTVKYGGTGLGLSISSKFGKLLGGEIDVDSVEGKGSTFSILIPSALEGGIEYIEPISEQKSIQSRTLKTALVVEDNPTQNKVISLFVQNEGMTVDSTLLGQEALTILEEKIPDLIILDHGLPDILGVDVFEKIKAREDMKDSIVIMFTAHDLNKKEIALFEERVNTKVILKSTNSNNELVDFVKSIHTKRENAIENNSTNPAVKKEENTVGQNLEGKLVTIVSSDLRFGFQLRKRLLELNAEVDIESASVEAFSENYDGFWIFDETMFDPEKLPSSGTVLIYVDPSSLEEFSNADVQVVDKANGIDSLIAQLG